MIKLDGRARVLGDDVNTDYIISSRRKKETIDPHLLKQYLLEDLDPGFAASALPGDLLVAGKNFGCGSAMEIAATVVLAAGIKAVIARSFARTYYRNAINNGLIPVECDVSEIKEGDRLTITLSDNSVLVRNETRRLEMSGLQLPKIMLDILCAGGLAPYFRINQDFRL